MSSLVLPVLNTVIALVFVYTLLSIISSNAVELYFAFRKVKAKRLAKIFGQIWGEQILTALKNHVLIDPAAGNDLTANTVQAKVLAKALIDIKATALNLSTTDPTVLFEGLKNQVNNAANDPLDQVLRALLRSADGIEQLEAELTAYIESLYQTEREKFKPLSQTYLFGCGLLIAVLLNISTIRLLGYFWDNPLEADAIAEQATAFVEKADSAGASDEGRKIYHSLKAKEIIDQLNAVKAPWGWVFIDDSAYVKVPDKQQDQGLITANTSVEVAQDSAPSPPVDTVAIEGVIRQQKKPKKPKAKPIFISQSQDSLNKKMDSRAEVYFQTLRRYLVSHEKGKIIRTNDFFCSVMDNFFNWRNLIGWVLTAAAISFGAPFWYDLLKQFTSLRKEIKGNG